MVLKKFLTSIALSGLIVSSWSMEEAIEHKSIVILGGGMSGLTTAYELTKRGIPATLYEGRDRLGGRTNTHYFDDSTFYEEGGTFIDDDHHAAIKLAKELGVKLKKRGYGTRDFSLWFKENAVNPTSFQKELKQLKKEFDNLVCEMNKTNDFSEFKEDRYVYKSLCEALSKLQISEYGMSLIRTHYEDESGLPLEKAPITAAYMIHKTITGFNQLMGFKKNFLVPNKWIDSQAYHYTVEKGMSSFVTQLHASINDNVSIYLQHKLVKLDYFDDRYLLKFCVGDEIREVSADQLIMTLPFSTLRHVELTDNLHFSLVTKVAIDTLPYGTNGKIGVVAEGKKNIYDQLLYHINCDTLQMGWPGEKTMTLLVAADKGQTLDEDSAENIISQEKSIIEGTLSCQFGKAHFKNWTQDPFSCGSYSARSIEEMTVLYNLNVDENENIQDNGTYAFAQPMNHNRFVFAGEHTRSDVPATIEGAIRSGMAAASIIAQK